MSLSNVTQKIQASTGGVYNLPPRQVILPALLIGNMAYKLGSEKNPQRRGDILSNSLVSWLGGVLLYNANGSINPVKTSVLKPLPYFTLPIVAGAIALYNIAKNDTSEGKTDTAINHASWWLTGIATQKLAAMAKLTGPFNVFCSFAVGASVIGPVIASFIKTKILPLLGKEKSNYIANTLSNIQPEYNVGNTVNANFSPFGNNEPAALKFSQTRQDPNVATNNPPNNFDPTDPFNLDSLVPGGFLK